jgi:hypothetical protein
MSEQAMEDLYPAGKGYHQAHEPYLATVVDAFEKAGFEVITWFADANDPRDGAIQLDPEALRTSADEVWVCWQEERRWYILTEYERGSGSEPAKIVHDAICDTVASPETVARAVLGHFKVSTDGVRADGHPDVDFPDHEFDTDNVALELALRRYAGSPSLRVSAEERSDDTTDLGGSE